MKWPAPWRDPRRAFRARPFICHYVEPVTPLRHPKESLDKLRFSVEKRHSHDVRAGFLGRGHHAGHVCRQFRRDQRRVPGRPGAHPVDPQGQHLHLRRRPQPPGHEDLGAAVRLAGDLHEPLHPGRDRPGTTACPCSAPAATTDSKVLDAQAGYEGRGEPGHGLPDRMAISSTTWGTWKWGTPPAWSS